MAASREETLLYDMRHIEEMRSQSIQSGILFLDRPNSDISYDIGQPEYSECGVGKVKLRVDVHPSEPTVLPDSSITMPITEKRLLRVGFISLKVFNEIETKARKGAENITQNLYKPPHSYVRRPDFSLELEKSKTISFLREREREEIKGVLPELGRKSLLSILKDLVVVSEERFFDPDEFAEATKYVSDFIRRFARKEILVVAGQLDPATHGHAYLVDAVRESFLRTGPAKILFGGESMEKLRTENRELWQLFEEGKIELYRLKEQPKHHYICIDGKTLALEQSHEPGKKGAIFFMESAGRYAKQYRKAFFDLLEQAEPIKIDSKEFH